MFAAGEEVLDGMEEMKIQDLLNTFAVGTEKRKRSPGAPDQELVGPIRDIVIKSSIMKIKEKLFKEDMGGFKSKVDLDSGKIFIPDYVAIATCATNLGITPKKITLGYELVAYRAFKEIDNVNEDNIVIMKWKNLIELAKERKNSRVQFCHGLQRKREEHKNKSATLIQVSLNNIQGT